MSSQFRRIYPPKGRILLDGGLNSKFERSIIEDNESPDCANVTVWNGIAETRQGAQKLNTAAIGSYVFDGLYTRRANTNAETMVAFAGGTMWQLAGSTFTTVPSAQSVFTAGVRVATEQFQNYMFIGNGGVIPYKYDGTNFTRQGVYPPTVTASVASNGVGALTQSGQYTYKVTYVNSALVESDLGPATATFVISTTSGQNRLTSIPVAPQSFGVASRYLYRKGGSATNYKRVTQIGDNTTTTYDDNVADSALGTDAPTDNGVPPNYSAICYHDNRLFMNDPANPNFVWYTDINAGGASPFTVPSTNFFKVGDNATDLVKGFEVYENAVVVYCERGPWINYMPDATPGNWKQVKIQSAYGSKSPFCLLNIREKQLFPAVQEGKFVGFAAIKGNISDISSSLLTVYSAGSDLHSNKIEPDMFNVQENFLGNISGIVFKNTAYISVPYGTSQTTNNRIYIYDFSYGDLSKNEKFSWIPWTGLNAAQFTIYSGKLYYGSSTATGFVYQLQTGTYNDDGAAIDSYLWTKEYSGYPDDTNFQKDFRYANILLENTGGYYMNITRRVDSDIGSGDSEQVSLNPGGSLWGTMRWGLDSWGGGSLQKEFRLQLGQSRGKRIQIKFSNQNTANQRFRVHGLNFLYNLKGFR